MGRNIKQAIAIVISTMLSTVVMAADTKITAVAGMSYGEQKIIASDDPDSGTGSIRYEFARVAIPISDSYVVQLDAERETYNQSGNDVAQSSSALGAHFSYKIPNKGLLGVFYARGFAESEDSENEDGWVTGLEGQYYISDDVTFYGQLGAGRIRVDDHEGFLENGWISRAVVRYFPMDDTKIEFAYGWSEVDDYIDGNDAGKFTSYTLNAETRLTSSMPLYATLSYRDSRFDATTENDLTKDRSWMLGLNYRFGVSSLKDNDRNGVTLDMPLQPIRAAGHTEAID